MHTARRVCTLHAAEETRPLASSSFRASANAQETSVLFARQRSYIANRGPVSVWLARGRVMYSGHPPRRAARKGEESPVLNHGEQGTYRAPVGGLDHFRIKKDTVKL